MSLTLRNGTWHFRKMINGQTVARSTKTGDKKLAEQIALKIESEFVTSVVIQGVKPVRLYEAITAFLRARKGSGGYENACTHPNHWKRLLSYKPVKDVQLFEVQAALAGRREEGAAHNTVSVFVSYWNGLQNFCKEQGWTSGPKIEGLKAQKTRIRVLTKDEEERLFAAIDPDAVYRGRNRIKTLQRQNNVDLLVVLFILGVRLNEAQKLRWSQVDFSRRVVDIKRSKQGVDSSLVMTSKLHETLLRRYELYRESGWVFPTKTDHKVNTDWIRDAVKRAGIDESAGKVTLNTMRHCFATRLLRGDLSLVEVQAMLGHKNIQSTIVCAHVQASSAAMRAAEVLEG
ncbi:tyrosine-type recombinase/integrase [Mitsuaria sp. CC2]|uniref:tyrosine-type recombinase/integrase n=1 Tax=Mitsuaria sp. CC2 TaxID=3029186 RepID=UPI003B8C7DB9